jgi:hypothetical protein
MQQATSQVQCAIVHAHTAPTHQRNKQCRRIAAITRCNLYSALDQCAYHKLVLCLGRCSIIMCLSIAAARSSCLIATGIQYVVTELHLPAGRSIAASRVVYFESKAFCQKKANLQRSQPRDEAQVYSSHCCSTVCAMLALSISLLSASAA